ncbi:MAG: hypothetical protein V7720_17100 [Halioglobus sp.]
MYRYSADNAVTYTSEDIVLFRDSPFACWMERLTLENPDHGIPPDSHSKPPGNYMQRQDQMAETLRAEDKNVTLIDWDAAEQVRRSATIDAMRQGVDFIVNGQLALGPLSGSANLLMRTSGYSELGNYLYIPCDTQAKTTLNSAFRLCFLADLLHSLQGQRPPQMLIIRGGSDLLPLETEDHIYHYLAVKQRFMQTMRDFRKHRMPDPSESGQFGRWSECANEVLKQRALRGDDTVEEVREEQPEPVALQAAVAAPAQPQFQPQAPQPAETPVEPKHGAKGIQVGDTLAAQARQLSPQAFQGRANVAPPSPAVNKSVMDVALQNLEFIGSSGRAPTIGQPSRPEPETGFKPERPVSDVVPEAALPEQMPVVAPVPEVRSAQVMPDVAPEPVPESAQTKSHPLDSSGIFAEPAQTKAAAPAVTPAPVLHTDGHEFEIDCVDDSDYQMPEEPAEFASAAPDAPEVYLSQASTGSEEPVEELEEREEGHSSTPRPFSSSLNTSDFLDD